MVCGDGVCLYFYVFVGFCLLVGSVSVFGGDIGKPMRECELFIIEIVENNNQTTNFKGWPLRVSARVAIH